MVGVNTFDPEPLPLASAKEPEVKAEEPEVKPDLAALEHQMAKLSIQDKKEDLKKQIKAIQARAKPSIMTMKELHAAFKQITDLKAQIHML